MLQAHHTVSAVLQDWAINGGLQAYGELQVPEVIRATDDYVLGQNC